MLLLLYINSVVQDQSNIYLKFVFREPYSLFEGGGGKYVIIRYAVKTYMRVGGITPLLLTSALDRCEWSDPRPYIFTTGNITHDNDSTQRWVGPRTSRNAMKRRQISCVCRNRTPSTHLSSPRLVAIRIEVKTMLICKVMQRRGTSLPTLCIRYVSLKLKGETLL
jgi:hypothetical protein